MVIAEAQPVIEIKQLKKTYPLPRKKRTQGLTEFTAVKDVTLQIKAGEIFGILGPNGAGKTSTLEILEGLRTASGGAVKILGFDLFTQSEQVKKEIGVQLQSSEYISELTLAELLELFASFYNVKADPMAVLRKVSLEDKIFNQVHTLSGGQKQRFTLATALVHNPKILFLDEPTTGLDPHARREVWNLIKQINERDGMTVILTTHYMEEATVLCDRLAIMDKGTIVKVGAPADLVAAANQNIWVSFYANDTASEQTLTQKLLWQLPGVIEVHAITPQVVLQVDSLQNVRTVFQELEMHNIAYSGFNIRSATLEDVYLDLTGNTLD